MLWEDPDDEDIDYEVSYEDIPLPNSNMSEERLRELADKEGECESVCAGAAPMYSDDPALLKAVKELAEDLRLHYNDLVDVAFHDARGRVVVVRKGMGPLLRYVADILNY